MKNEIKKLTRTEFFDVYGISLLLNKVEESYLLALIWPIAKKYLNITLYALRAELRYFKKGGSEKDGVDLKNWNCKLLKKKKINNWRKERLNLSIKDIIYLFDKGKWEYNYGGKAWTNIAYTCEDLQNVIQKKNLKQIILLIDRLNDLEHNNNLYLEDYSTFNLKYYLEEKKNKNTIKQFCSKEIKKLFR